MKHRAARRAERGVAGGDRSAPATGALVFWLAAAAATLALHAAGASIARDAAWGMHAYAFLPRAALAVAAVLLGIACFTAWRRFAGAPAPPPTGERRPVSRPAEFAAHAAGFAAVAVILWLARVRHTSLGDGAPLAESIAAGRASHPDSPLALALLQWWHQLASPWIGGDEAVAVAAGTIALASVLAGACFALLVWAVAGELTRAARAREAAAPVERALIAATLLLQGYVLVFFGYVETYAFVTVALALYAWLALRALRGGSVIAAGAALGLAIGFHLMAAVFAPTLAVLAWARLRDGETKRRVLVELVGVVAAGGVAVALLSLAGVGVAERLFAFARTALAGEGGAASPLWSGRHWANALQAVWLVGPVGVLAWSSGVALRRRGATAVFALSSGALALLAMLGVQDLRLGYARDWDLYAAPGWMLAVAGAALWSVRAGSDRAALVPRIGIWAIAAAIGAFHTVPWIAVNASRERAFARLQSLPLGYGRTETAVAFWLAKEEKWGEALSWTDRALGENPSNLAAWLLRADLSRRAGASADEALAWKRATRLRPADVRYRVRMLDALRRAGQTDWATREARLWMAEGGGEAARSLERLLAAGASDSVWSAASEAAVDGAR